MKRVLCVVLVAILLSGCAPDTPLGKSFWEAIKLEIFIGREGGSNVHYATNDVQKIKAFHDYIDHSTVVTPGDCDYEGRLILYFTETKTREFRFSLQRGCEHITYTDNDETRTNPLTPDGIEYLESLKRIR